MEIIDAEILFTPPNEEHRFLPEGPYPDSDGQLSWVAIQHGPSAQVGSLNRLDLSTGENQTFELSGRPGFAFPTTRANEFVIGLERSVICYNTKDHSYEQLVDGIDADVDNTIINDGIVFDDHLIFGCKDLAFANKKAGLYVWSADPGKLVQLKDDQVCSNGKVVSTLPDGRLRFYDICSCSKQVLAWDLDLASVSISNPQVVIDLTAEPVFPDGMIITPDERSLIVAIYDPREESEFGEARQYEIATGHLQRVWRCQASPRVTCPQLVAHDGRVQLVLTTAAEVMPPEVRQRLSNAGCLFIAETDFDGLNDTPVYPR
jgi:sugar lactone lactonase YvrE